MKEAEGFTRNRLVVRRADDSCRRDIRLSVPEKDGRRKERPANGLKGAARLIFVEMHQNSIQFETYVKKSS